MLEKMVSNEKKNVPTKGKNWTEKVRRAFAVFLQLSAVFCYFSLFFSFFAVFSSFFAVFSSFFADFCYFSLFFATFRCSKVVVVTRRVEVSVRDDGPAVHGIGVVAAESEKQKKRMALKHYFIF
jgi:hypothetical protein